MKSSPKILVVDVETAPIKAWLWNLYQRYTPHDRIVEDSYIIAWSAKWLDPNKPLTGNYEKDVQQVIHRNLRKGREEQDKPIVKELRDLIDEADMTLTQNGIDFDHPLINARIELNKLEKPSSYRMIDSMRIAKRRFRLPCYKLAYMTEKFNKHYKKLDHKEFPGFELWDECLKGNKEAWACMEKYNNFDILSLEELYVNTLRHWDEETNYFIYQDDIACRCGSTEFKKNGWHYNQTRKYQRYKCLRKGCGYEWRDVRATRCSRFTSTVTR